MSATTVVAGSFALTPWAGKPAGRCCSATRPAARRAPAPCLDPRQRWRCLFIDEVDRVLLDMSAPWATADNYNPAHPFPAIDEVSLAVSGPSSWPS